MMRILKYVFLSRILNLLRIIVRCASQTNQQLLLKRKLRIEQKSKRRSSRPNKFNRNSHLFLRQFTLVWFQPVQFLLKFALNSQKREKSKDRNHRMVIRLVKRVDVIKDLNWKLRKQLIIRHMQLKLFLKCKKF